MICLLYTFCALILIGALLLGRYTVELKWESDGKSHFFSLGALPWSGVFNIVWTGGHNSSQLYYRILAFKSVRKSGKKVRRTKKYHEETGKKPKRVSPSLLRSGLRVLPWTLPRLCRAFYVRKGLCALRLGAGDPASTGQLFGTVCAVQDFLPGDFEFDIEPDFSRSVIAGEALFMIRFSVLKLIGIALASAVQVGWQNVLDRYKR